MCVRHKRNNRGELAYNKCKSSFGGAVSCRFYRATDGRIQVRIDYMQMAWQKEGLNVDGSARRMPALLIDSFIRWPTYSRNNIVWHCRSGGTVSVSEESSVICVATALQPLTVEANCKEKFFNDMSIIFMVKKIIMYVILFNSFSRTKIHRKTFQ